MGAEQGQQAQQGECGVVAEQQQRRFSTLVRTRVGRYQQIKLVPLLAEMIGESAKKHKMSFFAVL